MNPRVGPYPERWRKLVATLNQLRDPIIVAGDWQTDTGVVLHVNPAWTKLTGFTPAEVLGRPGADILLAGADGVNNYNVLKAAVGAGDRFTQEINRPRKNAPPIPVTIRASAVRLVRGEDTYLVAAHLPVTEKTAEPKPKPRAASIDDNILSFNRLTDNHRSENHQLAESLVSAQLNFQNSLDACPFGVERTDTIGRIIYANPIYHDLLGYDQNELIGETVYERLQTPAHGRALETYVRHILTMRPAPTPILTTYRRKDGTLIDLRLDWSYDKSTAGAVTGLLCIVTPVRNETTRSDSGRNRERDIRDTPASPTEDAASDGRGEARILQQMLHAAQIWASILAHRHPEDADAEIVAKLDKAIDDGLRMLGGERRPLGPASSYYEETVPLVGLVVVIVEPVDILRASLTDLIRSWGCTPVAVDRTDETLTALMNSGRLPDIILVDLKEAIGLDGESLIQTLWDRYGPGLPAALIADSVSPEVERFAESVGMRIVRRPIHPIELRSTLLAIWRRIQERKK